MTNNHHYWIDKENRAKKAAAWTDTMETQHKDLIDRSTENTAIYADNNGRNRYFAPSGTHAPSIKLVDKDAVSAIVDEHHGKTAVLNFASYKNPGGMFLKGSCAQEESLCHESFLYNVLRRFEQAYYVPNNNTKNRAMYTNKALYSPDIVFYHDNHAVPCDVITCAAPNFSAGAKYANVTPEFNSRCLRSRIQFVLDVAACNHVDTLILGAFGCGVFGQNPKEVAIIMHNLLPEYPFKTVVFAIPDKNHANYKAFAEVFSA